jgi:hypothetical protein
VALTRHALEPILNNRPHSNDCRRPTTDESTKPESTALSVNGKRQGPTTFDLSIMLSMRPNTRTSQTMPTVNLDPPVLPGQPRQAPENGRQLRSHRLIPRLSDQPLGTLDRAHCDIELASGYGTFSHRASNLTRKAVSS